LLKCVNLYTLETQNSAIFGHQTCLVSTCTDTRVADRGTDPLLSPYPTLFPSLIFTQRELEMPGT
jgi:hypothetical protein